jgi:hypothetical protein
MENAFKITAFTNKIAYGPVFLSRNNQVGAKYLLKSAQCKTEQNACFIDGVFYYQGPIRILLEQRERFQPGAPLPSNISEAVKLSNFGYPKKYESLGDFFLIEANVQRLALDKGKKTTPRQDGLVSLANDASEIYEVSFRAVAANPFNGLDFAEDAISLSATIQEKRFADSYVETLADDETITRQISFSYYVKSYSQQFYISGEVDQIAIVQTLFKRFPPTVVSLSENGETIFYYLTNVNKYSLSFKGVNFQESVAYNVEQIAGEVSKISLQITGEYNVAS